MVSLVSRNQEYPFFCLKLKRQSTIMSIFYDNWEKLVGAVIKKQQLWELFHAQSRSPSTSSGSSGFSFSFFVDDLNLSLSAFEELGFYQNEESVNGEVSGSSLDLDEISEKSSISISNQSFKVRSLVRAFSYDHITSPGSDQISGHNSMGRHMSRHLYWQLSIRSPKYSGPNPSPRTPSPTPSSRIHSGGVTPFHPRAGGAHSVSQCNWPDYAKQQSHRLPLPPIIISNSSAFVHNSDVTSPSVPQGPCRAESLTSPGSRWKKGKLLVRGTFGHVYVGFNSDTGEMCAMKEVTLFSDDAKSKESAKQLGQDIALLSHLRHLNIVQYYGSENVEDKLCVYLEYVYGGSIHKILQEFGKLRESTIRSYTQQILSGLAFLHGKNTVHRDIKGANILVDPNGRLKLADFGMAKHITGQTSPLSFKGSPYWMAPEVIRNPNGCSLAVDIWSLGCTVLEMATSKPPWSQYEGAATMFKIGNSKELSVIPDHISIEGKSFVRLCLQRNPLDRPIASQLLKHPFLRNTAPLEKQISSPSSSGHPVVTNAVKSMGIGHARGLRQSGYRET